VRRVTVFLMSAGVAGAAWAVAPPADGPKPVYPTYPPPADAVHTPATGCAAASCHGGQSIGNKGSEQTTWAMHDPHTTAYKVLFNADSKRIAANLKIGKAHEAKQCLACHAVDADKLFHGENLGKMPSEGVGCDGCHGPSGKWLGEHYTASWKALTDRQKLDRYGFVPLKDYVTRAMSCAGCHVGEAGREVNHDLIAAGHPRLAFEYTRYHFADRYTQHWREPVANPTFELRTWYVGQVATLRAAVALLAARADRAVSDPAHHPWPELSEGSCYSCHRGIAKSPRAGGVLAPRPTGSLPWQTWYAGLADLLPKVHPQFLPGTPTPSLAAFGKLKELMGKPVVDPAAAAAAAKAAGAELDAWLVAVQDAQATGKFTDPDPTALAAALASSALNDAGTAPRDPDWDYLAEHYLGLAAAYHAAGGSTGTAAGWKATLDDIRTAVKFPDGTAKARFDSPVDFDPAKVVAGFRTFRSMTQPTTGGSR
jgi:Cytochrome c554 and c-prime